QLRQQELVRENLARVLNEGAQEIVFFRRKVHLLVADLDDAPDEIDGQITGPEYWPFTMDLKLVAQRGSHPRKQFVHSERLGDVIVGAEVQRLDLAGLVAAARQHDDRHALIPCAQRAQQFVSLDIGEPEIEDDQVGLLLQHIERGLAVRSLE